MTTEAEALLNPLTTSVTTFLDANNTPVAVKATKPIPVYVPDTVTIKTQNLYYDVTGTYFFNPYSCSEVLTYNPDNTLLTDTYTDPLTSYQFRQTYTYTFGLLTSVTGWVKL